MGSHKPFTIALPAIFSFALLASVSAASFPLNAPTRPTSFPLTRPSQVGEIVAWGANTFGQISVPQSATNVVAIAAAYRSSLALRSDGKVVAWGNGEGGFTNVPPSLSDVVAISAGPTFAVALRSNGTVLVWGGGGNSVAFPPAGLNNVVAIAAGGSHVVALRLDGTVVGWPSSSPGVQNFPVGLSGVVAIAATGGSSLALKADGSVVTWGSSSISLPSNSEVELGAVQLAGAIDGGSNRGLILRSDGTCYSLPTGSEFAPLNFRAISLAANYFSSIAINADRTVRFWTSNPQYSASITNIPPRLRDVIAVAIGENHGQIEAHALALKLPSPPVPTTAIASPQIVNGFVVGLTVVDGGEGYVEPPIVMISGGGGSGASATPQISQGVVTGFTMVSAGAGYTSTPTITISPPPMLPTLSISPSRVNVRMEVVPGKRYQLESALELSDFTAVGASFISQTRFITNEFIINETGQFFRVKEVP